MNSADGTEAALAACDYIDLLFLDWWEKEQGKRVLTTSEEVDAVRILTIHKSKGLEFEFVLLPFCSWELDSVRPVRRIWCMNNERGFNQLDYAPLNYSSKLTNTIFKKAYLDEHLKAYIDNLNLLYVALTRAKTDKCLHDCLFFLGCTLWLSRCRISELLFIVY